MHNFIRFQKYHVIHLIRAYKYEHTYLSLLERHILHHIPKIYPPRPPIYTEPAED